VPPALGGSDDVYYPKARHTHIPEPVHALMLMPGKWPMMFTSENRSATPHDQIWP
jgi:hypothetical protein